MGPKGTCIEVSCEDWRYNTRDLDCQDDRPSQLTAFLLSFFLSSTGAANFYIGRDDLGMERRKRGRRELEREKERKRGRREAERKKERAQRNKETRKVRTL